jgi:hypothetical protein
MFNSTFHFLIFVKTVLNKFNVEQVKEYQQAGRIPALQCKSLTLKEEMKLVLIMLTGAKCFILCFRKRNVSTKCLVKIFHHAMQ